jgi:hypothetical protein
LAPLVVPTEAPPTAITICRSPLIGSVGTSPPGQPDQFLAIAGPSPDDPINVQVLGTPMIDGGPVEISSQIALGFGHQVAGEGPYVGKFGRIIRRDNEPEMTRSSSHRSATTL